MSFCEHVAEMSAVTAFIILEALKINRPLDSVTAGRHRGAPFTLTVELRVDEIQRFFFWWLAKCNNIFIYLSLKLVCQAASRFSLRVLTGWKNRTHTSQRALSCWFEGLSDVWTWRMKPEWEVSVFRCLSAVCVRGFELLYCSTQFSPGQWNAVESTVKWNPDLYFSLFTHPVPGEPTDYMQ